MTANLESPATAVLVAAYLLAQNAHAGPVRPLATFNPGTTAKASEVNGNFSTVSAAVKANDLRIATLETNPNIAGNIALVDPSRATAGSVLKGTSRFIHNFGTADTFVGVNVGSFTMLSGGNTGVGTNALSGNADNGSRSAVGGINNAAIGTAALQLNITGSACVQGAYAT